MKITEPMTMATDYLLAAFCLVFAVLTLRTRSLHPAMLIWVEMFVVAAVAAILGGTHHGFKTNMNAGLAKGLWEFTLITIGASAAFMIAAATASGIRSGGDHAGWIWCGLIVSAAGFAVQKSGWDIHPNFNHNDLYHIIQIAGFWCLYEGARRLP
jgi:hypothetical protein